MERINPNSEEARIRRLTDEVVKYLSKMGGCVWETPRGPNSGPPINYVIDGEYYGFYPSVLRAGCRGGLHKPDMETVKRLQDAGANINIITNIERLETIMGMDKIKSEMHRVLPKRVVVDMLKSWGRGDPLPREVQDCIDQLKFDYRRLLYHRYYDLHSFNRIASDKKEPLETILTRHSRAVHALRNALLSTPSFMGSKPE